MRFALHDYVRFLKIAHPFGTTDRYGHSLNVFPGKGDGGGHSLIMFGGDDGSHMTQVPSHALGRCAG
jgi:hypothetical protein